MRRPGKFSARLLGLLFALLAMLPILARIAPAAHDAATATLVGRGATPGICPYRPHDGSFEKGLSVDGSFASVLFVQRLSIPPKRLLEQYCVGLTLDVAARDISGKVVVLAADGTGGEPGTRVAEIPFTINGRTVPETATCVANVNSWLPDGGNFWAGVEFPADGETFVAADNSLATPQRDIRVSIDGGSSWFDATVSTQVRSLAISWSWVRLGDIGSWGPTFQLDSSTPLSVSTAQVPFGSGGGEAITGVVLDDQGLSVCTLDLQDPSGTHTRTEIPKQGTHGAFTTVQPLSSGYYMSASVVGGAGDFDVFEVVWDFDFSGGDHDVRFGHRPAFGHPTERYIEVDAMQRADLPTLVGSNFDGESFDFYTRGPNGTWSMEQGIDVPGLLGGPVGASPSRWRQGIADPAAAIGVYSVATGPMTYRLDASIYDGSALLGKLSLAEDLPSQGRPGAAFLVNLAGPDGARGGDFPVYVYSDRGAVRAALLEWLGTDLVHRGTLDVGEFPVGEDADFGVAPGSSYTDVLISHPDSSGNGTLTRVLFTDPRNPSSWAVQKGPDPGGFFWGALGYDYSVTFDDFGPTVPPGPALADRYFLGPGSLGVAPFTPSSIPCVKTDRALCLAARRFRATASFRTAQGVVSEGTAVELTPDTGYFWFFDRNNVEIVVKVLDACGTAFQRYWVFAAGLTDVEVDLTVTDTATGAIQTYRNALKSAFQPVQDTSAFGTCAAGAAAAFDTDAAPTAPVESMAPPPAEARALAASAALPGWAVEALREVRLTAGSPRRDLAPRAGDCLPGPTALCLNDGRFRVEVEWETAQGQSGPGRGEELTSDTGYFWFFDQDNVEIVLKVLNACGSSFDSYWVFAAGLTDVAVDVTVTDTESGAVKLYRSPLRTPFQPIQDTAAFETCP